MGDPNADVGPSRVKVRRALSEEAKALTELALRSKAYWGYDARFMEACVAELTVSESGLGRYQTFVVETDRIVGFYMLCPHRDGEVELEMLFVDPDEIGHGHGKRLLDHAKETARAAGYRSMVIQGDPHADGFYRSQGGDRVGQRASESVQGRFLPVYRIGLVAVP